MEFDVSRSSWTFGEVSGALGTSLRFHPTKFTAFQSRLKNFHRLGFPSDLVAQKGKASRYSPHQIALLAIALEMTQLGVSPDVVVQILEENMPIVRLATAKAAKNFLAELRDPQGNANSDDVFIFFDPNLLHSYQEPEAAPAQTPSSTFFFGGFNALRTALSLSQWAGRCSVINLQPLFIRIFHNLPTDERRQDTVSWLEEIVEWSPPIGAEDWDKVMDKVHVMTGMSPDSVREALSHSTENHNVDQKA